MSCILTVTGATGAQGRSVIEHVVASKELMGQITGIRALCRDPSAERSKSLLRLSDKVELVKCDLSQPEDVKRAFSGSWAVFYNLNSYDPSIGPKEEAIGNKAVDIAKECGVQLFLLSSLPNASVRTNGRYFVPHFTNKARTEDYLRQSAGAMKFIVFQAAYYYSNFIGYFVPQKQSDGSFLLKLAIDGNTRISCNDVADLGGVVAGALQNWEKYVGKTISIAGDYLSMNEFVEKMGSHVGKTVRFETIPRDEMVSFAGPEVTDMVLYFQECGYYPSDADVDTAKRLFPRLKSFDDFLKSSNFKLSQ